MALTYTLCAFLLLSGGTVALVEVIHPEQDTSGAADALTHAVTAILGALLGLIAGRRLRNGE